MNFILIALVLVSAGINCVAQGQVVFANKVGTTVDAPVFIPGTQDGPGPGFTAQLFLSERGSLIPLTPTSTFQPKGSEGNALIADRYWETKLVDVPVQPGTDQAFVVRAYLTSFGSYDAAVKAGGPYGASDPFVVNVGGGTIPVPNLTTLKAFSMGPLGFPNFPEPSTLVLSILGAGTLLLFRRER